MKTLFLQVNTAIFCIKNAIKVKLSGQNGQNYRRFQFQKSVGMIFSLMFFKRSNAIKFQLRNPGLMTG